MSRNGARAKVQLDRALLKLGTDQLAELWGCSEEEAGRRVNGKRGIKLEDLAAALDAAGAAVIPPSEDVVLVSREQWRAIRVLARESSVFKDDEEEI